MQYSNTKREYPSVQPHQNLKYFSLFTAEELAELRDAEKAAGRSPDLAVDALMEATAIKGARESVVTEYMLKLLGLDVRALIPIRNHTKKSLSIIDGINMH